MQKILTAQPLTIKYYIMDNDTKCHIALLGTLDGDLVVPIAIQGSGISVFALEKLEINKTVQLYATQHTDLSIMQTVTDIALEITRRIGVTTPQYPDAIEIMFKTTPLKEFLNQSVADESLSEDRTFGATNYTNGLVMEARGQFLIARDGVLIGPFDTGTELKLGKEDRANAIEKLNSAIDRIQNGTVKYIKCTPEEFEAIDLNDAKDYNDECSSIIGTNEIISKEGSISSLCKDCLDGKCVHKPDPELCCGEYSSGQLKLSGRCACCDQLKILYSLIGYVTGELRSIPGFCASCASIIFEDTKLLEDIAGEQGQKITFGAFVSKYIEGDQSNMFDKFIIE